MRSTSTVAHGSTEATQEGDSMMNMPSQTSRRSALKALALAAGTQAAASLPAIGQTQPAYPNRPVRLIVPFPPGGATDIVPRATPRPMPGRRRGGPGQSFGVDTRSGASGNIGMAEAARAPADGHTLVLGAPQTLRINPLLFKKGPGFDVARDFGPIIVVGSVPNVLVVANKLPVKTTQELIAYARRHVGKLSYGSSSFGGTPHLSSEMFKTMTSTYIVHVPYRGSAPALQDLIGGQIDMMFDILPASLPHIRAGSVRALAVTTLKRSPSAPDLPTLDESGVAGFDSQGWFALLAPSGTPNQILERLNAEVNKILRTADFRARMERMGAETAGGSMDDLKQRIHSESERWGKVIRLANITAD